MRRSLGFAAPAVAVALACGERAQVEPPPPGPPPPGPAAPAIVDGPTVAATAFSAIVRWTTDRPALGSASAKGPRAAAADWPLAATEHALALYNLQPDSTYDLSVRAADPDDPTRAAEATLRFTTSAGPGRKWRVLFDQAHGASAGEANWVVDDSAPTPYPPSPSSEASWSGNYSAVAFDLWRTGRFEVESLPAGEALTYGTQAPRDLSGYDVLVLPEPNRWAFPAAPACGAECLAVLAFVRAGGGLLAIADHPQSDRDNDGLDSVDILNRIFQHGAVGLLIDAPKGSESTRPCSSDVAADPLAPVVRGPFGDARCVAFYAGGIVAAQPVQNPLARLVLWYTGGTGNTWGMIGVAEYDQGRIVLSGDSSSLADGTPSLGPGREVPWGNPSRGNTTLYLNAISWLAREY